MASNADSMSVFLVSFARDKTTPTQGLFAQVARKEA